MSHLDPKQYLMDGLEGAKKRFVQDLEALSDEQLNEASGQGGRKPIDFVYETGWVNRWMADQIKGQEPQKWPWNDGWPTAPEDFNTKQNAIEEITNSIDEIKSALEEKSEDDILTRFTENDRETSIFERAAIAMMHITYHDGQLNYIQAMSGDMEVNWK